MVSVDTFIDANKDCAHLALALLCVLTLLCYLWKVVTNDLKDAERMWTQVRTMEADY